MPRIFVERGFRFHFYSNEGHPQEPIHVHVAKRDVGDAKLWVYPKVRFAYTNGFDARTQRWIIGVVEERQVEIESAWHDHFGTGDQG